MRIGALTTRTRLELRRLVSPYPNLFVPLMRLRPAHDGHVIDSSTEIMIEGAPRSGNTFAAAAFEYAQGRPVGMARHLHGAGHVLEGIRRGVPVMVVCRDPRDSVTSQVIRHPGTTPAQALRQWITFHEPLVDHLDKFVVGEFGEVINDLGTVIRRVNTRFGTAFAPFEHTSSNVEAVFAIVDEMDRKDRGRRAEDPAATTARPTATRETMKQRLRPGLESPSMEGLLRRSEALHRRFITSNAKSET